ncbi:SMC-Scp complex subunit ScpB [Eubacterium sp.]|uniref:SMC-Scp complex subunit ScpB n=1 Tax=Eubacterium sp. TaxID=142586 RepID=UPI002FC5EC40
MENRQITMIDRRRYQGMIEAVLFASGEPVTLKDLAVAVDQKQDVVQQLLVEMEKAYQEEERGIRLLNVNGTWQLTTKPEHYAVVSDVLGLHQAAGLSKAALETLAIVAYRQPITRVEVEALRGVSSSSSIQLLLDRELITEAGRKDAPGRPFLYKTTDFFLKSVHLTSLAELPSFDLFSDAGQDLLEEAIL